MSTIRRMLSREYAVRDGLCYYVEGIRVFGCHLVDAEFSMVSQYEANKRLDGFSVPLLAPRVMVQQSVEFHSVYVKEPEPLAF